MCKSYGKRVLCSVFSLAFLLFFTSCEYTLPVPEPEEWSSTDSSTRSFTTGSAPSVSSYTISSPKSTYDQVAVINSAFTNIDASYTAEITDSL